MIAHIEKGASLPAWRCSDQKNYISTIQFAPTSFRGAKHRTSERQAKKHRFYLQKKLKFQLSQIICELSVYR